MIRRMICLLAFGFALAPAFGQTPDAYKTAVDKYAVEKAEAQKTFSKDEIAVSEELAAKADAAAKAGKPELALRFITDARWQLPVMVQGLPENVIRVLGASRMRHGDRVNSLVYSRDGARLASASRDGSVRIWDVNNGREVATYRGHEAAKYTDKEDKGTKEKPAINVRRAPAVAFSSDGAVVASGGANEVHLWEAKTGKFIAAFKGHKGEISSLAFGHKTPNLLVSGADDKKFIVWDTTTQKATYTSEDSGSKIEAVAFSPDDKQIAAVDSSGGMVIHKVGGDYKIGFGGQASDTGGLYSVAFGHDGTTVFIGGTGKGERSETEGRIKQISGPTGPDATNGTTLKRFGGHAGSVVGVGVTGDGKLLVSLAETDRAVFVWDAVSGKQLRSYQGDPNSGLGSALAVRPDGKQVAAGFENGQIRLFPLSSSDDHKLLSEAKDNLWACAYSPDGKSFATAGADKTIRLYESATGTMQKELVGHQMSVTALAYLNNGTLAASSGEKMVKIWDIASGTAKDCTGHTLAVLAVAADPTGKLLISGGADKSLRAWDPTTGQQKWKWEGTSAICGLAVSQDGKHIAVGCASGKLIVLNVGETGPTVSGEVAANSAGVSSVAFHPKGERVATGGGDGLAMTWAVPESGAPTKIQVFKQPFPLPPGSPAMPVTSVAFSPNGLQLVGGGSEGVVRIWDIASGNEARGLRAHSGWVTCVAYHPEGTSVLSVAVDLSARVFDLPKPGAGPAGHAKEVGCVAVSRDGKLAATGGHDKLIKVWDLASGREVANFVYESDDKEFVMIALTFVGSDRLAACGKNSKLQIFSIATGKPLGTKEFLRNGIALAANAEGTELGVAWFDNSSTKEMKSGFDLFGAGEKPISSSEFKLKDKAPDEMTSAALSPDARWGVIGQLDGVIRIWDLAKKERVGADWPILKGAVVDIGLTPDRKKVVVIDADGEVKVADTESRETVGKAKAINGEVKGVIVAPSGDVFATLAGDGTVKTWDMTAKELRTWKLPFAPTCAAFTTDGKRLITGNTNGTAFVLELK